MVTTMKPRLLAQCRPVTAIDICRKFTIVSEGPGVTVFSKNGTKLCQKTIFPCDKTILGISVCRTSQSRYSLFAFGKGFSSVFYYDDGFSFIPILRTDCSVLNEGVTYVGGRWLDNGQKLAAVTDENILSVYTLTVDGENSPSAPVVSRKTLRGVQTTLFSATLTGDTEEELIVFSGTNLSQIYVWLPQDSTKNFHLLLEGVKGSVLSLKYCDRNQILVASTDQRSIFAWKFTSAISNQSFSCKDFVSGTVAISLIAEMIGHTGRVWQVDILGDKIVSAGQDSNLLLWGTNGKLLKIFSGPSVVNVRCCRLESDEISVISGSDDGSVCQWNLSDPFTTTTLELNSSLGDDAATDYPRQVFCYNRGFIVSMLSGQFLLVNPSGRQSVIFSDSEFLSYSTLAVSPSGDEIVFGSKLGWVYFVTFKITESGDEITVDWCKCSQKLKFDTKIVSLHWVDNATVIAATCTTVLAIAKTQDSLQIDPENTWKEKQKFLISWKAHPGIAGAAKLTCSKGEDYLILGDELGSVHLFQIGQESTSPLFTIPKLHGIYGVCDLKVGLTPSQIWSVGRNRSIVNLNLETDPSPALVKVQAVESCLSWNAKLINTTLGSFVCGFSENDFVILDLAEDRIVKKFHCGGAHRSWDVAFNELITFAYIRHKKLTFTQFGLDSQNFQSGLFGGKTINVATVCPDLVSGSKGQSFGVLTSGEDGILRFSRVTVHSNGVTCSKLAKFKSHASSVRVIEVDHLNDDNTLLIFSGGGRSQIIASLLQCTDQNFTWSCKASLMLHNANNKSSTDPDMRIMGIEFRRHDSDSYSLLCACSDGFLRLVKLNGKRFKLISILSHADVGNPHAYTQVLGLSSFASSQTVYTSDSVGQLIISDWDTHGDESLETRLSTSLKALKTSEAGITALTGTKDSTSGDHIIVAGSDDGILKAFCARPASDISANNVELNLLFEDRRHHSAAINSVRIWKDKYLLAASADQVVTCRALTATGESNNCVSFRCGVSDVQDMNIAELTESSLLVLLVGQGFEIQRIDF